MQSQRKHHGHRRHGQSSPTYYSWLAMWDRCRRSHHPTHRHYSGVSVCDRWSSFDNFLADMGTRPDGMSLDRIDNSKGYSPDNCKWSTRTEQARNRSSNRLLTHNGQTKCLAQWAEDLRVNYWVLRDRLDRGWSVDRALGVSV